MAYSMVFVVSSDPAVRDSLLELIRSAGLSAEASSSLEVWEDSVGPERQGCLLLDARAHELAGPARLVRFAAICTARPVLLLVDRGDVAIAVRAIKDGAVDVVEKPYRDENLLQRLKRAAVVQDARASG